MERRAHFRSRHQLRSAPKRSSSPPAQPCQPLSRRGIACSLTPQAELFLLARLPDFAACPVEGRSCCALVLSLHSRSLLFVFCLRVFGGRVFAQGLLWLCQRVRARHPASLSRLPAAADECTRPSLWLRPAAPRLTLCAAAFTRSSTCSPADAGEEKLYDFHKAPARGQGCEPAICTKRGREASNW